MGMKARPNFVLIVTDQHRADHLGCYGNKIVQTPNIDSMADKGICFDRFYVATPVCMPNRGCMITGRMPSANGARHNGIPLSVDSTTYVDLLRSGGYNTALIGKGHIQNMTGLAPAKVSTVNPELPDPPVELKNAVRKTLTGSAYNRESAIAWKNNPDRKISLPFYGFDHVRICSSHGDRVNGHYTSWFRSKGGDPEKLVGPENALPDVRHTAPHSWRTRVPEELYPTTYITEQAISYLRKHDKNSEDKPFFLQVSFPDPHHPFTPPGRYWYMYDPDDIPAPVTFDDKIDSPLPPIPELAAGLRNDTGYRQAVQRVTLEQARSAIALNYGSISMIDSAVGRVLKELQDLNLSEDTVVIFTTDHGEYMGDRGVLFKYGLHYQELIRVPFIWQDPNIGVGGQRTNQLAGTVDIAATILERAGLNPYFGIQGKNVFTEAQNQSGVLIEDYTINYVQDPRRSLHFTSLVTKDWRMTCYETGNWGELFDLKNDPEERVNLWDDPEAGSNKAHLHEMMVHKLLASRDKSVAPTGEA